MDNHQQCNTPKSSPLSDMAAEDTEEKYSLPHSQKKNDCTNSNSNGGEINLSFVPDEKRVSIASDVIQSNVERSRNLSGDSQDSRYKSMLVNGDGLKSTPDGDQRLELPCQRNDMRRFTYESIEELHDVRNSWWYDLCTKCRKKETGGGWEPSFWSFLCPYPFCPTYRHVARVIALFFIGLLAWGIIYSVVGDDAAPGGQLFDIAVLCILAHFGGWAFRMLNLPALVGMLMVGIIYQNVGLINVHGHYTVVISVLRRVALVMILIRAGLDLDPQALRRLFCTVLRMGLIPWTIECIILTTLTHYLLGFPWLWGLLLGSIISAVAPAVVVPCLFRIRSKGYGVAKGIPTLVIAVSGIDDAASVAAFGIIHGVMFSHNALAFDIVMGPVSIIFGFLYGIFWGFIAKYIPEKDDPFVVPLRIILLLGSGLIAVLGGESVGMAGAGPIGCMSSAFMCIWIWSKQGWEIDDNPVATAYEIFWMIFEPILFSLTGAQIKIREIDPELFGVATGILVTGVVIRIGVTLLSGFKTSLNTKEKLFVSISWMAKASVQAALGPVALDLVRDQEGTPEYRYAEILLMMCIVSIILTAPLGAIVATLSGTRLLKKTASISQPEGWRRTHRPSLRDIQVADDDDDEDDEEDNKNKEQRSSRPSNAQSEKIPPSVVITMQP